jgi:F-type H+-transporting ATPase subunit alpha
VPVPDVRRFESEFLEYVARGDNVIFDTIRESKKLEDDTVQSLDKAVEDFYGQFETSDGESLKGEDSDAEPMDESERGQERVQVKRGN